MAPNGGHGEGDGRAPCSDGRRSVTGLLAFIACMSWKEALRLAAFVVILVLTLYVLVHLLVPYLLYGQYMDITPEQGIKIGNAYSSVISSSAGWTDTGIEIHEADVLSIDASGSCNTGFPTYLSQLEHQAVLCEWDAKRAAFERYSAGVLDTDKSPPDFLACEALRVWQNDTRFDHEQKDGLPPDWANNLPHIKKDSEAAKKESRRSEGELLCRCHYQYFHYLNKDTRSDGSDDGCKDYGTPWSIEGLDKAFSSPSFSPPFVSRVRAESREPRFAELATLPDSCLTTWILSKYVEAKFPAFGNVGPDGVGRERYTRFPYPEVGKQFPHFDNDSGMLCSGQPHGRLVAYIGYTDPNFDRTSAEPQHCLSVGRHLPSRAVERGGHLWLAVNDAKGFFSENMGDYQVRVRVRRAHWYNF